jgi:hypothetical protein
VQSPRSWRATESVVGQDAQHSSKRDASPGNRAPSPVTAALYSTLRAGTYRALLEDIGAQVTDTDALVLASNLNLREVSAAAEVGGVALRDQQELPDLGIVKARIVVLGKLLGPEADDRKLSPEARLHSTLDDREPIAFLAAAIEHVEECLRRELIDKRRVRHERAKVHCHGFS